MNLEFKERLLLIRKRRGMEQKQLARLLRTSGAAVSKWESGINHPNPNTITRIAIALGVTEDELTGVPQDAQREPEAKKNYASGQTQPGLQTQNGHPEEGGG